MRKLTILAATLLMIAPVASAQITAGPVGPFAMVDADGDLMGGVVALHPSVWGVALSTPSGSGFVTVNFSDSVSQILDTFHSPSLNFASANCTGQAYAQLDFSSGLDGGPRILVGPINQTVYALSDFPSAVTIGSAMDGSTGVCSANSGQYMALAATPVGSLANMFTPPFRIVTAASQTASVPMFGHISQWILAAALIGAFVLYDRRRLVRLGLS